MLRQMLASFEHFATLVAGWTCCGGSCFCCPCFRLYLEAICGRRVNELGLIGGSLDHFQLVLNGFWFIRIDHNGFGRRSSNRVRHCGGTPLDLQLGVANIRFLLNHHRCLSGDGRRSLASDRGDMGGRLGFAWTLLERDRGIRCGWTGQVHELHSLWLRFDSSRRSSGQEDLLIFRHDVFLLDLDLCILNLIWSRCQLHIRLTVHGGDLGLELHLHVCGHYQLFRIVHLGQDLRLVLLARTVRSVLDCERQETVLGGRKELDLLVHLLR